jgi:succinyl-diaminopimelate desuccinylase
LAGILRVPNIAAVATTPPIAGSNKARQILAWLRARHDEMTKLIEELIAIPTENPPGHDYGACAALLESRLRSYELDCRRYKTTELNEQTGSNDTPIILLAFHGHGERSLYFHGHYDVVPAQSPEQFAPMRKENFLFGRGSCDMKGGIVAMLFAILALRECGATLNGRIGLMLVPDEETGGARGSAWLAQEKLLGQNAIGMLTAEPTSGVVWNANRGAISLRVRVFGKSAHVGLQHHGENAFERMLCVAKALQELKRDVEQRVTSHPVEDENRRNSILLLGGQSAGGSNFNVVPDQCWFTVDRRINPEEDLATEKARLLDVLEKCRQDGVPLEWEILQEAPSAASPHDDRLARALAYSVNAVTGQSPSFEMCPGLLETRFYAAQGIPAYAYGPGLLSVAHGPNECVDLRKIVECAAIYALTAIQMLGPVD